MVVNKQVAKDKFIKEVSKAVNIATPAIDKYLNDHIDGDETTISIAGLNLSLINNKVYGETIKRICKIYEKSGWTVRFDAGEDRDRGTLSFS